MAVRPVGDLVGGATEELCCVCVLRCLCTVPCWCYSDVLFFPVVMLEEQTTTPDSRCGWTAQPALIYQQMYVVV